MKNMISEVVLPQHNGGGNLNENVESLVGMYMTPPNGGWTDKGMSNKIV